MEKQNQWILIVGALVTLFLIGNQIGFFAITDIGGSVEISSYKQISEEQVTLRVNDEVFRAGVIITAVTGSEITVPSIWGVNPMNFNIKQLPLTLEFKKEGFKNAQITIHQYDVGFAYDIVVNFEEDPQTPIGEILVDDGTPILFEKTTNLEMYDTSCKSLYGSGIEGGVSFTRGCLISKFNSVDNVEFESLKFGLRAIDSEGTFPITIGIRPETSSIYTTLWSGSIDVSTGFYPSYGFKLSSPYSLTRNNNYIISISSTDKLKMRDSGNTILYGFKCTEGEKACDGTNLFICQNNQVLNKGEVIGECGVTSLEEIISVYRLENNQCSLIGLLSSEKTSNDYDSLYECELKVISNKTYYRFQNNQCSSISISSIEKTSNDYSTLESCETNIIEEIICVPEEIKCEGTTYFTCLNNQWVNEGESSQCGFENRTIVYRFKNNDCDLIEIPVDEKSSNDYNSLNDCKLNIITPPTEVTTIRIIEDFSFQDIWEKYNILILIIGGLFLLVLITGGKK